MNGLTPKKLEKILENLVKLGIVEKNGDYYKMTDDGRELYTLKKAYDEKAEEMAKRIMEEQK